FDLAQPARKRGSQIGIAITIKFHLSKARTTTFVEAGPLFIVGPRFRDQILPLPAQRGMGWGIEIEWYDLLANGCRFGIVDGIVMEHLGIREYDEPEMPSRTREDA